MTNQRLREYIAQIHDIGKRAALCFCSHIPVEILDAAGFVPIRVTYVTGCAEVASSVLTSNICPLVKNVFDVCEDPAVAEADLIVAETSCDGKKKMFELLTHQNKLYLYQTAQGNDLGYVESLFRSECRYLRKMLLDRFGTEVLDEDIRKAAELRNLERDAVVDLMRVQTAVPPVTSGSRIYKILEEGRLILDIEERIHYYQMQTEQLLSTPSNMTAHAKRMLVTGCPMSGLIESLSAAIEDNGGVIVCFENCEAMKNADFHVDTDNPDVIQALSDGYRNCACAIMNPNKQRLLLLRSLCMEFGIEGILDLNMQACLPYSVEKDIIGRFCRNELKIPYMNLETGFSANEHGQLATRCAAFVEMISEGSGA